MRLFYLWYLGTLIFIIPIMLNPKDDNVDSTFANNQMSDSDSVFIFYPNEKCSTAIYTDTINCGKSKATLVNNSQNFIWCKFNVPKIKLIDEPYAGVGIFLKDTNDVINISNYDSIELTMIVLNADTTNGLFKMNCLSRLKHPENLPPIDTMSCDNPEKTSNLRHAYSPKHTVVTPKKKEYIYTTPIDSLTIPDYYKTPDTYTENFDKKRFYSLSIQTASNFPRNTEYNVIITSVRFKKHIQSQPIINSSSVHKSHPSILVLSIISCILYVLVITLLIRIRYKSKTDKGEKKQIITPSVSPIDTQPVLTQSFKADNNSNYSDNASTVITDTTGVIIRPTQETTDTTGIIIRSTAPLPLDEITINVLRKIAENPKLSTDDVARDNNKDSSTICKKIERDFGKGITISKLRLYFTALDIRNKNLEMDCYELHNHANKVITDAHGKLNSYKDLQDISVILQKKCPNDILDFFKKKYGDIQF